MAEWICLCTCCQCAGFRGALRDVRANQPWLSDGVMIGMALALSGD